MGQLGTAQNGARWEWSLVGRRDDPTTVVMPSWTSPSSSLGLLPGAGTILCCVPPACPSLEVLHLCSSPNQHASSPLDAIHFPCLLPSQRSQSQPGAASPLPNGGDTPHCVLHYTRDTFPPNPGLQNCEIKKGKSFPAGARPAGLAAVPGQPCSCPYPVHCQILQLVSCCALPIGSQIDFLYHGPVKCFSKAKILLFYGLNTGLLTAPGAGPGQRCGCRVSGSEKQLSQTPARAQSCLPTRDHAQHSASTQKSLADVAQHRQVPAAKVLAGFDVPLCLNLIRNPWLTVGLGGS